MEMNIEVNGNRAVLTKAPVDNITSVVREALTNASLGGQFALKVLKSEHAKNQNGKPFWLQHLLSNGVQISVEAGEERFKCALTSSAYQREGLYKALLHGNRGARVVQKKQVRRPGVLGGIIRDPALFHRVLAAITADADTAIAVSASVVCEKLLAAFPAAREVRAFGTLLKHLTKNGYLDIAVRRPRAYFVTDKMLTEAHGAAQPLKPEPETGNSPFFARVAELQKAAGRKSAVSAELERLRASVTELEAEMHRIEAAEKVIEEADALLRSRL